MPWMHALEFFNAGCKINKVCTKSFKFVLTNEAYRFRLAGLPGNLKQIPNAFAVKLSVISFMRNQI